MIGSNKLVMAGLVSAIHATIATADPVFVDARHTAGHDELRSLGEGPSGGSDQPIVKVPPVWIAREDQTHFPPSRPVFYVLLALDRRADIGMAFREYEPFEPVPLCEALNHPLPVFPDSLGKIGRHACGQGAVRPIGHDVDPSLVHSATLREVGHDSMDGRHKAGHDDKFGAIGAYV